MLIIDTVGSLMYEGVDEESENESKYNNGECDLVVLMIKELLDLGIQMKDIGVISPYNAQVNLIRK
jgi:superfamily I DNA and/or RNA helicase